MTVAIIEDETLIAKNLQRLLLQVDDSIQVLATLDSVGVAVKWLSENPHPDLLFMDIQLSDGVSFDIFKKIKVNGPVIFTTAYNEYAIRAFKVNSVDYLLKPIDKEYLAQALEKFKKYHFDSGGMTEKLKELMSTLANPSDKKYKERFLAHYKSGIVPLPEARVSYFVKDTIIYLVTAGNEKLVTDYATIDEIEEVVDPSKFFRANRQMIIHIDQVETYRKHDTGKIEVHLKCDKNVVVDVSREKANEFVNWLDR
ncbi:MAG: LytTR family two component transcriptional regulator [Bacteroidota bacterium]|nr:LytTR family two component transcriptional regulator [Bacteroidota bacterium]